MQTHVLPSNIHLELQEVKINTSISFFPKEDLSLLSENTPLMDTNDKLETSSCCRAGRGHSTVISNEDIPGDDIWGV